MSEHGSEHDARAMREHLASGFVVIKNAAISIGAAGLVSVAGLVAVPLLISQLGAAKFGIISLTWIIIGYTSLLDLGLGRALTKLTADRLGAGKAEEIPGLFWMAMALLLAIGTVTGGTIVGLSGWLANDVLTVGSNLASETQATFILLGCSVPFVLTSTALVGNLEAHQRFGLTNGVGIPLSFLSFFGPVAIAFFTPSLPAVVSAVCISRVCATLIYLVLCLRVDPLVRQERKLDPSQISPLLRFGGWVTVAAVLTGVMTSLDRMLIGARVSVKAVAFYATPFEASKQLLFVSASFSSVLFPGFAANVGRDRKRTETLFGRGVRATFVGLFPLVLIASVLSHQILEVWINQEFAENGGPILQLLPLGILINGLAFVAYALVQSTRPDIIAKIAAVELPLYLGALWMLLKIDGIEGAAIGFCLRTLLDTTALYFFTRHLNLVHTSTLFSIARMAVLGLAIVAAGSLVPGTGPKIAYVAIVLACFFPLAWTRILTDLERMRVREKVASIRSGGRLGVKNSAPDAA